jgi:hypothetical protein
MVTLTQAILEAAIDLRNKQNGIGEKDLETAIETVMESGGSTDSPGSFQNLQQFQKEEDGRVSPISLSPSMEKRQGLFYLDNRLGTIRRCYTSFLQVIYHYCSF